MGYHTSRSYYLMETNECAALAVLSYVLFLFCVCPVFVLCVYCVGTVWAYCLCSVCVLCVLCVCLYTLRVYWRCVYCLCVLCAHNVCTV